MMTGVDGCWYCTFSVRNKLLMGPGKMRELHLEDWRLEYRDLCMYKLETRSTMNFMKEKCKNGFNLLRIWTLRICVGFRGCLCGEEAGVEEAGI
jgi:hypothetical protein